MQAALPGYDIGGELGRGAFGVVYAGVHRQLGRQVAIKQLPRALAADAAVQQRFLAEARTAAALRHPNIVPVYDFVERDGLCLMVMAHLSGGALADRIDGGPLAVDDACRVVAEVLAALDHAHAQGVIHRDVKPENILFDDDGHAHLADFGIARMADASVRVTSTGTVVGTPAYLAPEVAMGTDAGPASDVYAAAAVLYESLSGHLPHLPRSTVTATLVSIVNDPPVPLTSVAPAVPTALADLVMHCLDKDPFARPAGAAAMAALLRAVTSPTLPPPAVPPPPTVLTAPAVSPVPVAAPSNRGRVVAVSIAAALLLAVVGAIVLGGSGDDADADRTLPAASAAPTNPAPTGPATTAAAAATQPTEPSTVPPTSSAPTSSATADTSVATVDTAVLAIDAPDISFPVDDLVTATAAFQTGCDTKGITPSACECMITGIVEQFGVPRFITVTNALAAKINVKKDIVDLATACLASS